MPSSKWALLSSLSPSVCLLTLSALHLAYWGQTYATHGSSGTCATLVRHPAPDFHLHVDGGTLHPLPKRNLPAPLSNCLAISIV